MTLAHKWGSDLGRRPERDCAVGLTHWSSWPHLHVSPQTLVGN